MKTWMKFLAGGILLYVHIAGLISDVPRLNILNETVRNIFFHVPMWFGMVLLFAFSLYYAIRYLRNPALENDIKSVEFANVGVAFGVLGMLTGMLWANYTWGSPWHGDPKQNGSAIALLVYMAYFVLRGSIDNRLRLIFYPAVVGWFAVGVWIATLRIRYRALAEKNLEIDETIR